MNFVSGNKILINGSMMWRLFYEECTCTGWVRDQDMIIAERLDNSSERLKTFCINMGVDDLCPGRHV